MIIVVNGKKVNLVLIGTEMDYNPRDLEETYEGSLSDNIYMDPATRKVYVERYMFANGLVEYDFDKRTKIAYAMSRFVSCTPECAYAKDDSHNDNCDSDESSSDCLFDVG